MCITAHNTEQNCSNSLPLSSRQSSLLRWCLRETLTPLASYPSVCSSTCFGTLRPSCHSTASKHWRNLASVYLLHVCCWLITVLNLHIDWFLFHFHSCCYLSIFTARRCISYNNSVCPSVCPSHAGIVSKRRHVARCSLHCWIASW